jgi:GNAT superfamily N-acetyltransferase
LPGPAREELLDLQFRAQRRDWEASFPDSEHELILLDGEPVGRIWVAWTPEECRIVDVTLLPAKRRLGIGGQAVSETIERADAAEIPVRIRALRENASALAFWKRFGFELRDGDQIYLALARPVGGVAAPAAR